MYEEDNYNHEPIKDSQKSENESNYNHYPNNYDTSKRESTSHIPQEPVKIKKKKSVLFKKVMASVCFGLLLGIFAGIGFYGMIKVANISDASLLISESGAETKAESQVSEQGQIEENTTDEPASESAANALKTPDTIATVVTDVTNVVQSVMPSVVSINSMYTTTETYWGQTTTRQEEGSGSGIIVGKNDTELLIATNYHVVQDADALSVQFIDEESVSAQVKGSDMGMDLAVISISLEAIKGSTMDSIKIATLGSSDALNVGEPVIAIGNALGYGQSVTTGVVSALNREITIENMTSELIQTDAAINPGNSGGALLNIKGEVIGINSNKIGGSVIEGMGYAIPVSSAQPIIEELMTKQTRAKVAEEQKAYLGITGLDVSAEISELYGMPLGVYVSKVSEGTAAANAGLVKGDIITEFDGEKIESMLELSDILEYYAAGTQVELLIMQGSPTGYQEKSVTLTLGAKVGQ